MLTPGPTSMARWMRSRSTVRRSARPRSRHLRLPGGWYDLTYSLPVVIDNGAPTISLQLDRNFVSGRLRQDLAGERQ